MKNKICIVHVDSGWILQNIAERVAAALPDVFEALPVGQISNMYLNEAENYSGWYYVDIQNCWMPPLKRKFPDVPHIGMFTHLHEDKWSNFRPHWGTLDGVVHMCHRYHDFFFENGAYDTDEMIVSRPGGDFEEHFEPKPIVIGIAQRGSDPDGNPIEGKGNPWLREAINSLPQEILSRLCLCFKGDGWEPSDYDCANAWIHEGEDYDGYYSFYMDIDYLLVPSLWEGGPMAPLEAFYMGVPVITADVGWMPDLIREAGSRSSSWAGGHLFKAGSKKGFREAMKDVFAYRLATHETVQKMTHAKHAEEIASFFERIADGKGA